MRETIMGADLKVGQFIKFNNRIYEILDLENEDDWSRIGDFRQTNGEIVSFDVFADSEYELRARWSVRARQRMVKVQAADLRLLLDRATYQNSGDLLAAVARLMEAVEAVK